MNAALIFKNLRPRDNEGEEEKSRDHEIGYPSAQSLFYRIHKQYHRYDRAFDRYEIQKYPEDTQ